MTDRARIDQFVGECLVKAAQIILVARIDKPTRPVARQGRSIWFNLQIDELLESQSELELWKRDILSPLVVEIYLQHEQAPGPGAASGSQPVSPSDAPEVASQGQGAGGTLLERWTLQFLPTTEDRSHLGRAQRSRLEPALIYKRMVIMLRSLFSHVRLLPAFRMYRASKRNSGASFSLHYRLSRRPTPADPSRATSAEARMQHFSFSPVDTPTGRLTMSIDYFTSAAMTWLEQRPAPAASPQIIMDYVGSQQAAGTSRGAHSCLSSSLRHGYSDQLPDPASSPPVTTGAGILRTVSSPAPALMRRQSWSLQNAFQEDTLAALKPAPPAPPRPAAGTPVEGHLSRQVHAHQQQQQQLLQQGHLPFAPSTPGNAGLQQATGTPPRHPHPLEQRAAAESAASPSASGPGFVAQHASRAPMPAPHAQLGSTPATEAAETALCSSSAAACGAGPGSPGASVQRRTSAPVCIPGSGNGRACASSGDLWAMGEDPRTRRRRSQEVSNLAHADARTPASAPATSHTLPTGTARQHAAAANQPPAQLLPAGGHSEKATPGSGETGLAAPATPPAAQQMPILASEDSSYASSFPASCSPLLPFAFTPSQHSLAENTAPGSMPKAGASPPISGRAGPGALTLVRRLPSWSLRTSTLDLPPPAVGYSVSPMHDSLESSLWSASTPRHPTHLQRPRSSLPSPAPSPPTGRGVARSGSSSISAQASGQAPARLTHPERMWSYGSEDAESDALPFALDSDSTGLPSTGSDALLTSREAQEGPAAAKGSPAAGCNLSGHMDDEVGAFVRLIQEARPLDNSTYGGSLAFGELLAGNTAATNVAGGRWAPGTSSLGAERTLQASLDQLKAFKDSLLPPVP